MSLYDGEVWGGLCVLHHQIHMQLLSGTRVHSTLHVQEPVSFCSNHSVKLVHHSFFVLSDAETAYTYDLHGCATQAHSASMQ